MRKILRPFRLWFLIIFVINIVIMGLNLINAHILQMIINTAFNTEMIWSLIVFLIAIIATGIIAKYLYAYFVNKLGISFGKNIKNMLFERLLNSKIKEVDRFTHGAILSKMNVELEEIINFISTSLATILFQPVMFLGAAIYMITLNWKLFLACFILSPLFLLMINILSKKSAKYSESYYENLSLVNGLIMDSIRNIEVIKSYNMLDDFLAKFDKQFENILKYVSKSEKLDAISLPFYFLISESPKIICLLFGGYLALTEQITLESLVAYIYLLTFVDSPLMNMTYIFGETRKFFVQMNNVNELFNMEPEDMQSGASLAAGLEQVSLNDVAFSYQEGGEVLSKLSLTISKGEKIALIGASGSGKSTLFYLLCRFYDTDSGEYMLNGLNHADLSLHDIRSNITYVSQTPYFLHSTIHENLIFGREGIADEEIDKAIDMAGLKEYIANLPDGYDTIIEERGRNLSGGEQLRMSIARAFIRPADIIILDEPTASLDTGNEERLLQNILLNYPNKTVLLSSHRSSTVQKMNRIICMKDGKIIENEPKEV